MNTRAVKDARIRAGMLQERSDTLSAQVDDPNTTDLEHQAFVDALFACEAALSDAIAQVAML